ncbi:hypothetical protein ABPG74_020998 [Tetrahymena malaccensis]
MYICQWICPRLFMLVPVAFTIEIISLFRSGEYKECLIIFLAMMNYNFLFVVILMRFFTSMNFENIMRLKVKMYIILAIIIFNMITISYVITLNFYAVLLLFFGDSLFNDFCKLNCMSDPKAAKHVILFNIIFLLSDVTWVLRAEMFFLKQYEMYIHPERYQFQQMYYEMQIIHEIERPSLDSQDYDSKISLRETTCQICLEEIQKDEKVIKLKCTHSFHSACIRDWIKIRVTCPSCRRSIHSNKLIVQDNHLQEQQQQAAQQQIQQNNEYNIQQQQQIQQNINQNSQIQQNQMLAPQMLDNSVSNQLQSNNLVSNNRSSQGQQHLINQSNQQQRQINSQQIENTTQINQHNNSSQQIIDHLNLEQPLL